MNDAQYRKYGREAARSINIAVKNLTVIRVFVKDLITKDLHKDRTIGPFVRALRSECLDTIQVIDDSGLES